MRRRNLLVYAATAVLAATVGVFIAPTGASAHGAMMVPGSRTYFCWKDGLNGTNGAIIPKNPACAAAVAKNGTTPLYNWFAVLRSDGGGRMAGFIPDGQLCSGGTGGPYDFTGYNLPRADWPVTHLTSGASMRFDYNNWAKHPGTFSLYITKDSWSPTRALAWSDLESTPFSQVVNPESVGGPGTNDGRYSWNANLPSGKSGKHIIYSVWSRSDSTETFYGCSDVTFDGGNGEVTGIGQSGDPGTSPCQATFAVTNTWSGGFQAEVTVKNPGTAAMNGWTVSWLTPSGQQVASVWNGTLTVSGDLAAVRNADWNRTVAAGASTTFGLVAQGPATVPTLTCVSP